MDVSKELGLKDLKGEIWKDIEGYEGYYQVSNLGRIKSLERRVIVCTWTKFMREKIMSAGRKDNLYLFVVLCKDKIHKANYIHRLVAKSFLQNPEDKPTVNHINGNKKDNRLENLEWSTHLENITHAVDNQLMTNKGEMHGNSKISEQVALEIKNKTDGIFHKDIGEMYGISQTQVSRIKRGENWKHLK